MVRKPVYTILAGVLAVSGAIEWLRYLMYSAEYQANPDLWLISGGAVALNLAFHRWMLPETFPKLLVSAAVTQAGLPVVIHVIQKAALLLAKELIVSPRGTEPKY